MMASLKRHARELARVGGLALASVAITWGLVGASYAQSGGGYEVSAQVVAAGEIRAVGGSTLELAATVAQPDATTSASGGPYRVSGGFWPVAASPPPTDALFGDGFE